jgi:uncharacterized RDD family membrane protein YckC
MENIRVETTQNVDIEYGLASIGDRIIASIIDGLLIGLGFVTLIVILSLFEEFIWTGGAFFTVAILIIISAAVFYPLYMEYFFNGQSIGKIAMKIRVVKLDGSQPAFTAYFLRWLLRLFEVNITSGAVAIVSILVTSKSQRLGDLAAGTTVIKIEKRTSLRDTIFHYVEDNYEPVFQSAANLEVSDIDLMKRLIEKNKRHNVEPSIIDATYMAKSKFEEKINTRSDMPPLEFFHTLIKDYNKLAGKL